MSTTASIASHEVPTRQRPRLITVAQTAEMLALSRSSIYQLIWTDQLVPIRIGRSVRISVEHLERFAADRSDVSCSCLDRCGHNVGVVGRRGDRRLNDAEWLRAQYAERSITDLADASSQSA